MGRIEVVTASWRVHVELAGVTLADSDQPSILREAKLRPRYYLPMSDVRMDLLEESRSHTFCPYKGQASYWSGVVGGQRYDDIAWCYRTPFGEARQVAGLVCFYDEKVELTVEPSETEGTAQSP